MMGIRCTKMKYIYGVIQKTLPIGPLTLLFSRPLKGRERRRVRGAMGIFLKSCRNDILTVFDV